MRNWQYKNLQFKTVPSMGFWSRVSDKDLATLAGFQADGWMVYHTVNIRGSLGFTSYVLFMLRREMD